MAIYGVYSHEECIVVEVEGSVTGRVSHRHFETNAEGPLNHGRVPHTSCHL